MQQPTPEQIRLAARLKEAVAGFRPEDIMLAGAALIVRAALAQSCCLSNAAERIENMIETTIRSIFDNREHAERLLGRDDCCAAEDTPPPQRRH